MTVTSRPAGPAPSSPQRPPVLTDRDWQLVRDVARFRLQHGLQLQRLHFGEGEAAARAARRNLLRLTSARVLARLPRVVGGLRAGSSGFVYALGPVGDRLIRGSGSRTRSQDIRDGFLNHTLAISELYVGLVEAARGGAFDLVHVETEPRTWQQLGGLLGNDWLKPDLHVVLAAGEEEHHSYVEWDNGTEHVPTLTRKLRQYETAYRQTRDGLFPRVVWLVPSQRRLDKLRRLISGAGGVTAELHAVGLQTQALALLSGLPPGELDSANHQPLPAETPAGADLTPGEEVHHA